MPIILTPLPTVRKFLSMLKVHHSLSWVEENEFFLVRPETRIKSTGCFLFFNLSSNTLINYALSGPSQDT